MLKNENKGDDMVDIMLHHHQYVPSHEFARNVHIDGVEQETEVPEAAVKKILFSGDQLTASRARGAKRARGNSLSSVSRLNGLEPTASDFHVQLNLLDVSKLLYPIIEFIGNY